jgi:hypothetical protein
MLLRYLEFSNLTDTQLIEFVQLGPILLSVQKTEYLTLIGKNKRPFKIETKILEWLVGFSDANFHLRI